MTLFSYAKGGTVLAWSSCAGNPRWTAFPAIVQIRTPEPHKRINNVPRKPWQSTIKPHFQHRHPSTSSRDDHIRRSCVGPSFLDCLNQTREKGDDNQVEEQTCHQNKLPLNHKPGTPTSQIWQRSLGPSSSPPTRQSISKIVHSPSSSASRSSRFDRDWLRYLEEARVWEP